MDEAKKKLRNLKKMAELLGIEYDESEIAKAASTPSSQQLTEESSRTAEAVLLFGEDRRKFIQVECKNCGGVFAVNRSCVSYCSDTCRAHSLGRKGILWDWRKNVEARWEFREPLVVPPQVLTPLVEHLDSYQVQQDEQLLQPVELIQQDYAVVELNVDDLLADLA